jgi:hypothetical protein
MNNQLLILKTNCFERKYNEVTKEIDIISIEQLSFKIQGTIEQKEELEKLLNSKNIYEVYKRENYWDIDSDRRTPTIFINLKDDNEEMLYIEIYTKYNIGQRSQIIIWGVDHNDFNKYGVYDCDNTNIYESIKNAFKILNKLK